MRTIPAFRSWLVDENYSPRTRQQYLHYVTRARLGIGEPLHRVTSADLRAWWSTLPPSAASRNAARNALLAYYRSRGPANPARALPRVPEPLALPRPVPLEDYERLIDAGRELGGRYELLALLLAYTGCRIGEARIARRCQFDLRAGTWRIEGKGSKRRGAKERVVAVHPELARGVGASPEPDWLFPSPCRTGPVARTTIGQYVRDIREHAGLDLTAHRVRHTVATIGLERSRDIRAVQELLGHASLATTQRYTAVSGARVRSVVELLGPSRTSVRPL